MYALACTQTNLRGEIHLKSLKCCMARFPLLITWNDTNFYTRRMTSEGA